MSIVESWSRQQLEAQYETANELYLERGRQIARCWRYHKAMMLERDEARASLQMLYHDWMADLDEARGWARKMKAERDEALAEKQRLYSILDDWGDVCSICGAVLLPDECYLGGSCPKCDGVMAERRLP